MVFLVILSIGMMVADYQSHYLTALRSAISTAMYPIEYLVALPVEMYRWGSKSFATRSKLLSDNARLQAKQIRLELQLQKLAALKRENARLRELSSPITHFGKERSLTAELLSVNLHPYHQRIVLNKGTRHGVYAGQPLLDAKGIIGQIDKVSLFSSIAILISDPNHALLGTVVRSGERGLIAGTGNTDKLNLQHLTISADIKTGDLVTTSGLDDLYPADYPIGKITSIQKTPGKPFIDVEVKPLANLNTMREVLLIWPHSEDTNSATDSANAH